MGRVFLAEDPVLNRRLAIKVLPPEFTHDPLRRDRLLHEARAASALNHPNIVIVHDLGESEGTLFLAMELVDGRTLRTWMQESKRAPAEALSLMRQATAALHVAHAAGLVHRDLKPENLLVRRDGLLKILDFGLARSLAPEEGRTSTMPGTVMGTAPYMSPEQVLGRPAGPASDLFSLGTILYELLTGRHPFAAESMVDTMHRILHETPEPASRVNPALSSDFDFVLAKALSKDPQRRHASARDLDVDLETLECGCGPTPTPERTSAKGPRAIAVLPFKNIGGNPDLNYLGVGLADAVITRLMSSPDLVVRSTGLIAAYENQPVEPRRVGQELDVTAVLDASFQRAGERFRATARLVETPSGRALWAGKVDLRFEDIFEVQDQVAHGIAEALTARLSGEEASAARAGRHRFIPSAEAYELVMRGLEAHREATLEGFHRAIEAYQRAVALEPGYAQAWALLATAMHGMIDGGFDSDPAWYSKAEHAVERARAIDPENGQMTFVSAAQHLVFGRKREAYRELLVARRRMPNQALVYHYVAYLFRLCNMLDQGLRAEERAIQIDPHETWPYWSIVRFHVLRGDHESAHAAIERARLRFPGHPRTAHLEGMLLVQEGRYREAIERLEGLPRVSLLVSPRVDLALAYVKTGDSARCREIYAGLESYVAVDMDHAALAAALAAQLGETEKAFLCLAKAVELGNDTLALYERAALYGPLHTDPRWDPFLEAMRRRVAEYQREFRWPLPE